MTVASLPRKLWQHPDPESTSMGRFQRELQQATGRKFDVRALDP
jgi:acetoacetyl-CoA synthetase